MIEHSGTRYVVDPKLGRLRQFSHPFEAIEFESKFIVAREVLMPVQLSEKVMWPQDPALWSPVKIAGPRPHTRRSGPMGLETAFFCHDFPLRARCRRQIRLWGLQFDGGGALWCSNGPAAESGEGYMGNAGYDRNKSPDAISTI